MHGYRDVIIVKQDFNGLSLSKPNNKTMMQTWCFLARTGKATRLAYRVADAVPEGYIFYSKR